MQTPVEVQQVLDMKIMAIGDCDASMETQTFWVVPPRAATGLLGKHSFSGIVFYICGNEVVGCLGWCSGFQRDCCQIETFQTSFRDVRQATAALQFDVRRLSRRGCCPLMALAILLILCICARS